jgi:hypothetical protein
VLVGDVTGDGKPDLVLLRPAQASGSSASRSRVRVLRWIDGALFQDVTEASVPAVDGEEDLRADDGVLADIDGDEDLDLVLVTPAELELRDEDGEDVGDLSSLRILVNDGTGVFADETADRVPPLTSWGDRNQGVAVAAADFDGVNGPDLAVLHSDFFTETIVEVIDPGDPGATPPVPPVIETTVNHYAGLRILLNDGDGGFVRALGALPAVDDDDVHQFQGEALAVGDADGQDGPDVVLARDLVVEKPAGTGRRSAVLLRNLGDGTFEDASSSLLPAASDPDYLQADGLVLADADGDDDLDLLLHSNTPLASPGSSTASAVPALRLLRNDGAGAFAADAASPFPARDREDRHQADAVALGDLTGDGKPEVVLVSARAPNAGERGGRVLVAKGSAWVQGSAALPGPPLGDDVHGADVALFDADGDGDLDVVIVRDDPDETVRNTRLLLNPRRNPAP